MLFSTSSQNNPLLKIESSFVFSVFNCSSSRNQKRYYPASEQTFRRTDKERQNRFLNGQENRKGRPNVQKRTREKEESKNETGGSEISKVETRRDMTEERKVKSEGNKGREKELPTSRE